jgi:hypothetical protein
MQTSRDFLIWLAGFIDGEACLATQCRSPWSRYRFSIYQNNEPGARIVQEIRSNLDFGTITHRTRILNSKATDEWAFHVSRRDDLLQLLPRIIPFLRIKKAKACEALAYLRAHPPIKRYTQMRDWTDTEIQTLKGNYPAHGALAVARSLGRSEGSVQGMVHRLGLKCNDARISEKQRVNVKMRARDSFGQFVRLVGM